MGVFEDMTVLLEQTLHSDSGSTSFTVRTVDRPPELFGEDVRKDTWFFTMRPGFEDERTRRAAKAVENANSLQEAILAASIEGAGPDYVVTQESSWVTARNYWMSISDARTGEILYSDPQAKQERKCRHNKGGKKKAG
jgi:hypothetical protein